MIHRSLTRIFFISFLALAGCSSLLYYPTDFIYVDPKKISAEPEEHEFALDDGIKIQGWYFRAKEKPAKAVVLFFHGNGQNRSSHYLSLFWLVEKGYDLAVFDYPGYGISDGKPTPKNTVEMGKKALQYIRDLDPQLPLVVYGQSLGGVVAIRSVIEMKGKVEPHLLVVDSSFLSYRKAAQKVMAKSIWTWPLQPISFLIFSDEWAAKDRIQDLTNTPLVVIHSRQDELVPFELGEEIYRSAQTKKQFWIKERGSHISTFSGADGEYYKEKLMTALPK